MPAMAQPPVATAIIVSASLMYRSGNWTVRIGRRGKDSNLRPPLCCSSALPLSYAPSLKLEIYLIGPVSSR